MFAPKTNPNRLTSPEVICRADEVQVGDFIVITRTFGGTIITRVVEREIIGDDVEIKTASGEVTSTSIGNTFVNFRGSLLIQERS